jgi:hypothetical protein
MVASSWQALWMMRTRLFFVFLTGVVTSIGFLCPFAFDTSCTRATVRTGEGEINVLLAVKTNNEGGDVDDLFANADVALSD